MPWQLQQHTPALISPYLSNWLGFRFVVLKDLNYEDQWQSKSSFTKPKTMLLTLWDIDPEMVVPRKNGSFPDQMIIWRWVSLFISRNKNGKNGNWSMNRSYSQRGLWYCVIFTGWCHVPFNGSFNYVKSLQWPGWCSHGPIIAVWKTAAIERTNSPTCKQVALAINA